MKTQLLPHSKVADSPASQSSEPLSMPCITSAEQGVPVIEEFTLKARIECAQQLRSQTIYFVDDTSFHEVDAERKIVDVPYPKDDEALRLRHSESAKLSIPGMRPPLSAAQELYLFRKMNFLKFQAHQAIGALSEEAPDAHALEKIQECMQGAQGIVNQIVASNLPLVSHVVKTYTPGQISRDEMFSEGCLWLLNAIKKFDCSRGYRFSTYLVRAVKNGINACFRKVALDKRHIKRFAELERASRPCRSEEGIKAHHYDELKGSVSAMLKELPDREKLAVIHRFGLDGEEPLSFADTGKKIGISNEGARKVEARARTMIFDSYGNPLNELV